MARKRDRHDDAAEALAEDIERRCAVALDGDCIDLIALELRKAARHERGECQRLAAFYGGADAESVAELIRQRNYN